MRKIALEGPDLLRLPGISWWSWVHSLWPLFWGWWIFFPRQPVGNLQPLGAWNQWPFEWLGDFGWIRFFAESSGKCHYHFVCFQLNHGVYIPLKLDIDTQDDAIFQSEDTFAGKKKDMLRAGCIFQIPFEMGWVGEKKITGTNHTCVYMCILRSICLHIFFFIYKKNFNYIYIIYSYNKHKSG